MTWGQCSSAKPDLLLHEMADEDAAEERDESGPVLGAQQAAFLLNVQLEQHVLEHDALANQLQQRALVRPQVLESEAQNGLDAQLLHGIVALLQQVLQMLEQRCGLGQRLRHVIAVALTLRCKTCILGSRLNSSR